MLMPCVQSVTELDSVTCYSHAMLATRKEKLVEVYSQVYDEFLAWSASHNRGLLQSLVAGSPSMAPSGGLRRTQQHRPTRRQMPLDSDSRFSFTVFDYDSGGTLLGNSELAPLFINVLKHLAVKPYHRYESCSAANRSRMILSRLPKASASFIPYADQPEFDYENYLAKFKQFAWQTKPSDLEPDGMYS